MWIDAHAHLYDFPPDALDSLLYRAQASGVVAIVNAGTDLASSEKTVAQSTANHGLFAAVGISPFDVEKASDDWLVKLERLMKHPRVIAIGETGLDSSNPIYPSLDRQLPVFETLLDCAVRHDLPVVIHSRGAEARVVDICRAHGVCKVLMHCYTGNLTVLRTLLDLGYYVSFSGIATFKNGPLDKQIAFSPIDRMLIETDTPYLAPVPHRGKPNEPALLPLVGEYLARQKSIPPKDLAAAIEQNFTTLFGIAPDDRVTAPRPE